MSGLTFEERLKASGLTVPDADRTMLETLVNDIDAAAALCRVEWPYEAEPLTGFRFPAPG